MNMNHSFIVHNSIWNAKAGRIAKILQLKVWNDTDQLKDNRIKSREKT